MVEEKESGCHGLAVEGGHGLCQLSEVINDDDDIMITSSGCWVAFPKIDGPLTKGADYNDMMEGPGAARVF